MLSFSLSFASNLNFSLTFSKSYGKMKNILKAIAGWFATWNYNVVNFSAKSYFKGWNISKQAKCNKSEEENGGTEKVKCCRWEGSEQREEELHPGNRFSANFTLCIARAHQKFNCFIRTVESQYPVVKRRNTTHEKSIIQRWQKLQEHHEK